MFLTKRTTSIEKSAKKTTENYVTEKKFPQIPMLRNFPPPALVITVIVVRMLPTTTPGATTQSARNRLR